MSLHQGGDGVVAALRQEPGSMHDNTGHTATHVPWVSATSFQVDRDPTFWKQECWTLMDETLKRLQYVEGIVDAEIDTACAMSVLATVIAQTQRVGLLVLEHRLRDCIAEASTGSLETKADAYQEWSRALERFVHTLG